MLTNSCVKLQTVHSIPLTINKEGGPPPAPHPPGRRSLLLSALSWGWGPLCPGLYVLLSASPWSGRDKLG